VTCSSTCHWNSRIVSTATHSIGAEIHLRVYNGQFCILHSELSSAYHTVSKCTDFNVKFENFSGGEAAIVKYWLGVRYHASIPTLKLLPSHVVVLSCYFVKCFVKWHFICGGSRLRMKWTAVTSLATQSIVDRSYWNWYFLNLYIDECSND